MAPLDGAVNDEPLPWAAIAYKWLLDHLPKSRRGRIIVTIVAAVLVLLPSAGLLIVTLVVKDLTKHLEAFGYAGVFLANFASTVTVFIPVPGLTAASQTLIITQGNVLNPLFVGLLGGTGMALGEVTAYGAGAVGSGAAQESHFEPPVAIRPALVRVIRSVEWLMSRYGFITLLALSAIPNPAFEIAGITAGATRMNFWRFMLAVLIGKNVRGLLLAYISVPYLT